MTLDEPRDDRTHRAVVKYKEATTQDDAHAKFVYVEDDGSARELTVDECIFLSTEFEAFDSGRPYVKSRYRARTPDGRLCGFLERRKLPRRVAIRPSDPQTR